MVLLSDDEIDRIVVNRRRYLLGGLMVMILPFMIFPFMLPRGWGIGLFSGFMLSSLGIYGLAFRKWRFDPGLWMLAVLLTLTLGPCLAHFEYLQYHSLFVKGPNNVVRPITWDQIGFSADAGVALLLFSRVVKSAASVAVKNWKRTRPSRHKQQAPQTTSV